MTSKTVEEPNGSSNLIKQLMNQSTIYARHQRRRNTSYALREDPRPAVVRVLSGLPGFRILIEPYKPPSGDSTQISATNTTDFYFSQDTIFSNKLDDRPANKTRPLVQHTLSQVVVAATFGGACSECFSHWPISSSTYRTTPYSMGTSPFRTTMQGGTPDLLAFLQHHTPSDSKAFAVPTQTGAANCMRVVSGAAFAGLLFGTKSLVETKMGIENSSSTFLLNAIGSSASAGAVVATFLTPLQAVRSHMVLGQSMGPVAPVSFHQGVLSLVRSEGVTGLYKGARLVYGREILGATLYFSFYDTMKQYLSSATADNDKSKIQKASNFTIAASGAVAGMLYRSVVHAFDTTYSARVGLVLSRGGFSAVLRAAPANALLFLGYETILSIISDAKQ